MFSLKRVVLAALATSSLALRHVGVDWSSVEVEEKSGINYTSYNGKPEPLEKILAAAGANTVRQRVWVNPSSGQYNLDYNLRIAKRAKSQGLDVYVDLHFSDTWADPNSQAIPSGWPTDIDSLSYRLYNYTKNISNSFSAAGVHPTIVSIGNEIRNGLLFPTGRVSNPYNVARLLHSAAWGIKDSNLDPKPKIMIHLDNGWSWATQNEWYSSVLAAGPLFLSDFDMMGVSFYPFYDERATMINLETSLNNMAKAWGKELIVAETNWPTSCPSPSHAFPSDVRDVPFSANGQREYIRRVASVVASVPGGAGLFYWEPAWVDNQALGSSCNSNTMFAYPGKALSSLSIFSTLQ